jgi:predicted DNA-binding transcriptional regulator YafY
MYHPTGRVLTVLELLQSRPGLTGTELARRLETDVRSVRRYITKLQDVGIPVEATPGRIGGYRLRPGYKLPPLLFSEPEAMAIVLGLMGSPWLEIDQAPEAVEGALSKIARVLPQGARDKVLAMSSMVILAGEEAARPNASLLLLLGDAVQARQCLDIRYKAESGAPTHRVVEPYGLVGREGKWYLVGWCRLRADYRTFRLDRIRKAVPMDERFARDEGFDFRAYALQALTSYPTNVRIRVLFAPPASRVRARIPASLGTLTPTKKGLVLEWSTDDCDYAARYLLSLGLRFSVLDPPELRAALRGVAEEAARAAEEPRASRPGGPAPRGIAGRGRSADNPRQ